LDRGNGKIQDRRLLADGGNSTSLDESRQLKLQMLGHSIGHSLKSAPCAEKIYALAKRYFDARRFMFPVGTVSLQQHFAVLQSSHAHLICARRCVAIQNRASTPVKNSLMLPRPCYLEQDCILRLSALDRARVGIDLILLQSPPLFGRWRCHNAIVS